MSELSRVYVRTMPQLTNHPNADNLLVGELDGLNFIVNKQDGVKSGESFILIPYDLIVPDREEFGFVRGQRIRPMRLRGIFSCAVCLPNTWGFEEGEEVSEKLGFTKWEPKECRDDGVELQNTQNGRQIQAPFELLKYDIESLLKYKDEFELGEDVLVQEKIEGANIALVWYEDKLWVRTRTRWIEEGDNQWWRPVKKHNWDWLKEHPGLVVFGENYGNVPKFRYDLGNTGERDICVFDLYDSTSRIFLEIDDFLSITKENNVKTAPILYRGPYQGLDVYKTMAEENSVWGNHIREGVVVRSDKLSVRWFARKIYKCVSQRYLLHKGRTK